MPGGLDHPTGTTLVHVHHPCLHGACRREVQRPGAPRDAPGAVDGTSGPGLVGPVRRVRQRSPELPGQKDRTPRGAVG